MNNKIQHAVINTASPGDNTIVAAATGLKTKVLTYTFTVGAAVTVTWKSASTAISGPMAFEAGISSAPSGEVPHFETIAGEALVLNLGSAVQVSGHISYYQEGE